MPSEGKPPGTILWTILRVQQLQLPQIRQQAKTHCLILPWFSHTTVSCHPLCFLFDRLCNGHGRCECNQCVCDEDWDGESCDCYKRIDACMAKNQLLCNGRGVCKCGMCACQDSRYLGPTCEICPTCPGACVLTVECVECLAFGTGPKKAV